MYQAREAFTQKIRLSNSNNSYVCCPKHPIQLFCPRLNYQNRVALI